MKMIVKIVSMSFFLQCLMVLCGDNGNISMSKNLLLNFPVRAVNIPKDMILLLTEPVFLDPDLDFEALITDADVKKKLDVKSILAGRNPRTYFLLLKDRNGGTVHALLKCHLGNPQHLILDVLVVSPYHRNKGIARLMLTLMENMAIVQGVKEISLVVSCDNAVAINLYKSNGYISELV